MATKQKISCPKPDVLAQAFLKGLSEKERERLTEHISLCPQCRIKFKAMMQVQTFLAKGESSLHEWELSRTEQKELRRRAKQKRKELLIEKKGSHPRLSLIRYAVLPFCLLILLIGIIFFHPKIQTKDLLRSGAKKELRLLEPEGKIKKPPSVFRWTELPGTDYYVFELIDDELNTLFCGNTSETRINLAPEVKDKLLQKKTYIWTVEAFDDEENKIESALEYFEIK